VIAGPLLTAASIAAYTLADSLETLVLLRLVTGVGEGMVFVGRAPGVPPPVWRPAAARAPAATLAGLALPETRPARHEPPSRTRIVHPAAVGPGLVLIASAFGFAGFNAFVALYGSGSSDGGCPTSSGRSRRPGRRSRSSPPDC
jgi:hypothetical protein